MGVLFRIWGLGRGLAIVGHVLGYTICKAREIIQGDFVAHYALAKQVDDVLLWHHRLRHPNFLDMKQMYPELLNKTYGFPSCEICQ